MKTAARKLTYADYASIPEDGCRHEIIGGEECMTPAPNPDHQTTLFNLIRLVGNHVIAQSLGRVLTAPIDVVLSKHDIVQPDLLFIARKRVSIIGPRNVREAPDLVVEVLSPSTASLDRGSKLQLYDRSGVREYWIVDLGARTVEAHEFGRSRRTRVFQEGQSFTSELLPGLNITVASIFE